MVGIAILHVLYTAFTPDKGNHKHSLNQMLHVIKFSEKHSKFGITFSDDKIYLKNFVG